MSANSFLDPNQLGGIRQRSTIDAGLYLTHIICPGWLKQCHTSVIAFNVAQFFPSLNRLFLTKCLGKAGLSPSIINFFNSYHTNRSTTYTWNGFTFPPFNTNVGVSQGSVLSSIISAMYMVPIIKTFKKRIKNLKEKIPSDILSFVDDSLLISQEKSYELSSVFLLCSYNIMSKLLFNAGLVTEHSKLEVFYFTRSQRPPNHPLDLTSVGGPVLTPKPIWRYLGFFFDCKLNFHHHTHFYATKCLSTLNAMRLLGNAYRGILPLQKRLFYRTCILPIALYGFQLWFFKGAPIVHNIYELKKMQRRAALWVTDAFCTAPSKGIEAITGLILIHLCKLNRRHHLRYASIPPSHAINSLLDTAHSKNQTPHRFATSNLTDKQQVKLKSPIKDVNECLNGVISCFDPTHLLFSPGMRVVDHFSSRITFHSPLSSSDEDIYAHMQKLDHAFKQSQTLPYHIAIIADGGVKKSNVALAVTHIWIDNHVTNQLSLQAMNITLLETELMSIGLGLTPTLVNNSVYNITVITDSMGAAKKLLESRPNPHQRAILPIINLIKSFLSKNNRNAIHFWQCPKKAEWPRHKLVDDQVKTLNDTSILSSKNSHLFSQKKEVDDILKEWQTTFATSQKKGQLFLDFEDEKQRVITPTYTKGGS